MIFSSISLSSSSSKDELMMALVNVGIVHVLVDLGRRRRPGIATLREAQDRFTDADISSNLKGRGVSLSLQHFILGRRE